MLLWKLEMVVIKQIVLPKSGGKEDAKETFCVVSIILVFKKPPFS